MTDNYVIHFIRIPSEQRGYSVWYTWLNYNGFLIGTVRPSGTGMKRWEARFDDGRKPNARTGDKMIFRTRKAASEWLVEVAGKV